MNTGSISTLRRSGYALTWKQFCAL